jgi:sugar/nucleoside kinase (ribokinase family)
MPVELVAFGIVIDDIVFPDGQTAMGVLGGGGPQAAFGMRLWSDAVGLVAGVGADLPLTAREWLDRSGIDLEGLSVDRDLPTPRAWQVMEADGRRTQVWRVAGPVIGRQLGRSLERLNPTYRKARGYHFGIHPDEPDLAFARDLAGLGGLVSIEPFKSAERPADGEGLARLSQAAHIFSPNVEEAASMVGREDLTPLKLAQAFCAAGGQVIPLRMGPLGSLALDGRTGLAAHIPAYPTQVVDPTGAGNAYCGGFLAGWAASGDLVTAGLCGAISASFLMETVGTPLVTETVRSEARRRFDELRPQVRIEHV